MRCEWLFWIKDTLCVDKYCDIDYLSQAALSKIEESQDYVIQDEECKYQQNMIQLILEHEEGLLSIDEQLKHKEGPAHRRIFEVK